MIILTGANSVTAKDESVSGNGGFSFKDVIQETVRKANELGYTPVVYDLGSLGIGEPFQVEDSDFATKGYYSVETQSGYRSRSLFKPAMVKDCMTRHKEFTVYLDGDALLYDRIDDVAGDDYDVGVTLRRTSEMEGDWYEEYFEIVKFVNAGVIFFNHTEATMRFLDRWREKTKEVGNDQKAFNSLTCPEHLPEVNSVLNINGVRIKYFSGETYNYYYFEEGLLPEIRIMHFKGPVRRYFPFDWKKRLYCMTVIPAINMMRPFLKRLVK